MRVRLSHFESDPANEVKSFDSRLRRSLAAIGDALQPHRGVVLLLTGLAELAVLGALSPVRTEDATLGIAVSFMALAAVVAGTLAGPLVGSLAALVGGGIFFATIADLGADTSLLATAISTAMWVLAALSSGTIAKALREQVGKRQEASVALAQAEAVRQTAERLLEATASFHGGQSLSEVADDVCRTALSSFDCLSAALFLVEEATLRPVAIAPYASLKAVGRLSFEDYRGLARLVALERPALLTDARSIESLAPGATPDLASLLPGNTVVFVPLRVGEEPLALLALGWQQVSQRPDDERLAVMQRFGDQAAIALLETRRAHARAEVAGLHATLETGLLPVLPVDHPALAVVTAYRPGEDRLLLGGDFYDVLSLPDGRLALILGDVAGHGPNAAALGAKLRAGWQALTLSGADPFTIMSSLEKVVAAHRAPDLFATAVLAWIDPASHSAALLSAGHPPPLLMEKAVRRVRLRPHLPLGLGEGGSRRPTTVKLPRGWTLLFYTDGLIEGRAAPGAAERYGEAGLMSVLHRSASGRFDGKALDRVLAEVEAANGAAFGDDVAVVAVSERLKGHLTEPG